MINVTLHPYLFESFVENFAFEDNDFLTMFFQSTTKIAFVEDMWCIIQNLDGNVAQLS